MPKNDPRLRAGLIVITGAGSGLGQALAVNLAGQGLRVAGFGRRAGALAETANLAGPGFYPFAVDIADAEAVADVFAQAQAQIAPVTVLINNAAVYPRRDILDETPASFMATVQVNLGGTFACTLAALTQMTKTGFGRIINVSSFAAAAPIPASAGYAVSKGAVQILGRALVADLGDRFPGIVINDWAPGILATGMGMPQGLDPAVSARWGVELALWHDPDLTGTVFERDHELLEPLSLKRRIRNMLLLRSAPERRWLGRN